MEWLGGCVVFMLLLASPTLAHFGVIYTTRMEAHLRRAEGGMPSIEPFEPQSKGQPWGEEILVAHAPGLYTGKVLRRYAPPVWHDAAGLQVGPPWHRAGLQWHRVKDETFYLYEGEVYVFFDTGDGKLRRAHMTPGQSFHVPPGAVHSVQTITDSVMFEASTAVFEDRVRVEDNYDITVFEEWP